MPHSNSHTMDSSDDRPVATRRRRIASAIVALAVAAMIAPAAASGDLVCQDEPGSLPCENSGHPDGGDHGLPEPEDDGPEVVPVITTDVGTSIPSGTCTWTIKGRLVVRNPTIDGLVDNDPVEGVEVKVSGRPLVGVYSNWGSDTTDANGDFSVTESVCGDRKIKVQAKFESDDLRVTSSTSRTWYLMYESSSTKPVSTIDLKREPFGGEVGEQSTTQARTDAQTWAVIQRAMDYTDSKGHPFLGKVVVHNPATLTSGVSAADPILKDMHIDPSDTADLDTTLHELGHVYWYRHVTGEGCLTWNALLSGDTHDAVEPPCVALSEAFATFFSDKIEYEMDAAGIIQSTESASETKPMDRAGLAQTYGLNSLGEMTTREQGWEQVFRVLASADITRHLFGTASGSPGLVSTWGGAACVGQPVDQDDLADVLQVVGDANDQLDISDDSALTVSAILDRAEDRLASFDSTDEARYLAAIDPASSSEPHTLYGC
jgi:hypothetical protein